VLAANRHIFHAGERIVLPIHSRYESDPSEEQLEKLSRAELVALVKPLLAEIEQLKARVAELEAQISPGPLPATSRNSAQPPSRDQKTNTGEQKSHQRAGAKPGHQAVIRPLVEQPDRVIEAKVAQCANCYADLHQVAPDRIIRHQLAELPVVRPPLLRRRFTGLAVILNGMIILPTYLAVT
jgi:hypothetical protein